MMNTTTPKGMPDSQCETGFYRHTESSKGNNHISTITLELQWSCGVLKISDHVAIFRQSMMPNL